MTELIALIIIFWTPVLIVLAKKFLWDMYFWQIKEYRWDRFWTHLIWDQDEHNRNYFVLGIKFILFATITLLFEVPFLALIAIVLAYIIWVFESFEFISEFITKKVIRPAIRSLRNIIIFVMLIVFVLSIVTFISAPFLEFSRSEDLLDNNNVLVEYISEFSSSTEVREYPDIFILIGFLALIGLFIDIASPFIVPIGVFLTSPLAYLKKQYILLKGKIKYDRLKNNLTLIGITGSQGKTTTKEVLFEILKDKFKTSKTPENYNTAIGISHAIQNDVNEDTEVFIAEMGAYKKGEIKEACLNFTPDISVITDIDTQHIGLFGSRSNLARAKSEIVRYMKDKGVAILNGDNHNCRDIARQLTNFVVLVSSDRDSDPELKNLEDAKCKVYRAYNVESSDSNLQFEFEDSDERTEIDLKNFPSHLINSAMICIAICKEIGMTTTEVSKLLAKLTMKLPRLVVETGDNDTLILDDSYNSSVKGFTAAVEMMNKVKEEQKRNKRIVITKGIFELGRQKSFLYKELAHKINGKIDVLITSDAQLAKTVMMDNTSIEIIKVRSNEEMIYKFREKTSPGDIILLEGRLNPKLIQAVVSEKK